MGDETTTTPDSPHRPSLPNSLPSITTDALSMASDLDEDDLEFSTAPNGGYGWVIVVCAWLSLVIAAGTVNMFGMIYPSIMQTFEAGDVYTVAIFTSSYFSLHIICVFAGSLCDIFGCRVVALLGNAIAAVGLIMAAFASHFAVLFIGYGIMTGSGFGIIYIANVVIIQQYFTSKRSIAFGIANSGIGLGLFVYAPLTRALLVAYAWRGTLLILAGLWLHGLIFASLLRPLPPPKLNPLTQHPKAALARLKSQRSLSYYSSVPMMPSIYSSQMSNLGQSRRSLSSRKHTDRDGMSSQVLGHSYRSLSVRQQYIDKDGISSQLSNLGQSHRSLSTRQRFDTCTSSQTQLGTSYRALPIVEEHSARDKNVSAKKIEANGVIMARQDNGSTKKLEENGVTKEKDETGATKETTENGPTRKILENGSTKAIDPPKQQLQNSQLQMNTNESHPNGISYPTRDISPTSVHTLHSLETDSTCCSSCSRLFNSIWDAINLSDFLNVYVILFTLIMASCVAFTMLPVYLPRKCAEVGFTSGQIATLLSLAGLMDTIGRVLLGFLGYRFDVTILNTICISGIAIAIISIAFTDNFWCILVLVVVGYLSFGGYASMCSANVVQFVGVEKFARSYGFTLFGSSLGFILAGPVVSQIYTVTSSYTVVFVVLGCMALTGAILCCVVLGLRALRCGTIYDPETDSIDV